jgi:hypothetical protein
MFFNSAESSVPEGSSGGDLMFFNSAESIVPEGSPGGEVGRARPIGGGGQLRHGQPARHLHTAHHKF